MQDPLQTWFSAPNFNRETIERIRCLVASAAYVVGMEASFLVLEAEDSFDVPIEHGSAAQRFCQSDVLVLSLLAMPLDHRGQVCWPAEERSRRGAHNLQSLVAVPITQGVHRIGVLAVCDTRRVRMSAAHQHVLATLAAEIGTHLELQYLRRWHRETTLSHRSLEMRMRLLESVVVHANDAVIVTEAAPIDSPGPRILYVNAAFTRMTGYSSEDVLGCTPRLLQGPQTASGSRLLLREALRQWKPIELELLNYRKDGSSFWIELSIVPVSDETGQVTHWVSVQRDITGRKQLP